MNIIGDIVSTLNDSFSILTDEDDSALLENEELGASLGIEDVATIPLQQWYAPFNQILDYSKDNSYNTLSYLNKLGYTHAIWELCESHDVPDICDSLHGRQFTLHELLLNAQHYPPSPMFTLSHPQCFCFLKVFPPAGPEGIPDDAPGLPYNYQQVTPTGKPTLKFKKKLYSKMFEVFIDAFTALPPQDDVLKYSSTNLESFSASKYAAPKRAIYTHISPVSITKTVNSFQPLHFSRAIEQGVLGCQVKVTNNFSIVYVGSMNRLVVLPSRVLSHFRFKTGEEVNSKNLTQGDFVVLSNEIIGVFQQKDEKQFSCYIPEWAANTLIEHQTVIRLIK